MQEAFENADVVYPKSWAPFWAMEMRTQLYEKGDFDGMKNLEKELLSENAKHKDWECTDNMMSLTKNSNALYMHCLPADITGVSCRSGEVSASVFEKYRVELYKEAGFKPYIIAAMIFLSKVKNPIDTFEKLINNGKPRFLNNNYVFKGGQYV